MADQQVPIVMEDMLDPAALAQARVQDERYKRNFAWFQAHAAEIVTRHRGKCICEVGRTHLSLAELAQHRGHRDVMMLHLTAAYSLFTAWHAPVYAQHTAQRARALGLTCAEPISPTASNPAD